MSEPEERDDEPQDQPDDAHAAGDGDDGEEAGFDPESRRLCPDDTCTGLIGPDGRCKVCGALSPDGPPPAPGGGEPTAAAERPPAPRPPIAVAAADADGFDPDARTLCSDDTCTGLVGPDGRCKVCGKPYEA